MVECKLTVPTTASHLQIGILPAQLKLNTKRTSPRLSPDIRPLQLFSLGSLPTSQDAQGAILPSSPTGQPPPPHTSNLSTPTIWSPWVMKGLASPRCQTAVILSPRDLVSTGLPTLPSHTSTSAHTICTLALGERPIPGGLSGFKPMLKPPMLLASQSSWKSMARLLIQMRNLGKLRSSLPRQRETCTGSMVMISRLERHLMMGMRSIMAPMSIPLW